ncbi:MAG: histidinol-phosphate transaminase [Anaerolineae bacterium]
MTSETLTTTAARFARPEVRGLSAYHLDPHTVSIKLNQNENAAGFPDELKEAVWERIRDLDWARYPDFHLTAITQRLAAHAGVPPDWILVGNGSNEVLQMTLLTTVGRGDSVVIPVPTFTLYKLQATAMGAAVHTLQLQPDQDFALSAADVIDLARRHAAKVVVVCSPNNPTGARYGEDTLGEICANVDGLVLLDEAYREFCDQDLVPLLAEHDNIVLFRTFSKALAMAGLRVGYCIAPPALAREIGKVKLPYALNIVSEAVTLAALDRPDLFAPTIETARAERARVSAALGAMPGVRVYPSAANFVLARFDAGAAHVFDGLLAHSILVRDVSHYPGLANHLRISVGTPAENDALLTALREM